MALLNAVDRQGISKCIEFCPSKMPVCYIAEKIMTITENACLTVPGFTDFYQKFLRRMAIYDRAKSTSTSYGRSQAALALHYNKLPTTLSISEVEEYLYLVKQLSENRSENNFKFTVASLRFVFKMEGLDELRLQLPAIRKIKKLPVVLSKQEMTAMMNIPCLLKHRVLIAILYGCGLRCAEARNIKVGDIDLDRCVLHVRMGKGKKDRYMPLGKNLPVIIAKYLKIQKPQSWLFPGMRHGKNSPRFFSVFETQFGQRSIQWAIGRAAQLAGITKRVNVHCLRHTYATHLLEDGVNILTIKELMGHANIRTTMIYLHVAQINNYQKCSPLDTLQGLKVIGTVQGELIFE
jgi:site-specific recombinase XerD